MLKKETQIMLKSQSDRLFPSQIQLRSEWKFHKHCFKKMIRPMVSVTTPKQLFYNYYKRFYKFVNLNNKLAYEVWFACKMFEKVLGKSILYASDKEIANFFGKRLYELARQNGFRKISGKWQKSEIAFSEIKGE